MVKVILRNYNKSKGKVLYCGHYKNTVRNYVYHYLINDLNDLNKINNFTFIDEDDFIDIEQNNKHLIYTLHDLYNGTISEALRLIDKDMKK